MTYLKVPYSYYYTICMYTCILFYFLNQPRWHVLNGYVEIVRSIEISNNEKLSNICLTYRSFQSKTKISPTPLRCVTETVEIQNRLHKRMCAIEKSCGSMCIFVSIIFAAIVTRCMWFLNIFVGRILFIFFFFKKKVKMSASRK